MLLELEKKQLIESVQKSNIEFSRTIMSLLEKYQILSDDDLTMLCDRSESRRLFSCDYSYFKQIDESKDFASQLRSLDGRSRFYNVKYKLNERFFVMTSQLYGFGTNPTHKDCRTPFYEWILPKFGIDISTDEWWPSQTEYPLNLTKEDWKNYKKRLKEKNRK